MVETEKYLMVWANRIIRFGFVAVLILSCLNWTGCTRGDAAERVHRADLVTIDGMKFYGELERAPVAYPHDLHTDMIRKQNGDCTVCHLVLEDGRISPLFMRRAESTRQEVMDLYHDTCVECHKDKAAAGEQAGPVTCGVCHTREPAYISSRQPFGMDKSLHYRHIKAYDEKCETCHHRYDEETKKLVYEKGKENSCRDCHRMQTEERGSAFRLAAHEGCIGCHQDVAKNSPTKPVGPSTCEGCHDRGRQKAIQIVEHPPRLKRGQPDFVLLSVAGEEIESSKLKTVPFSHRAHEEFTGTCRDCHHETLLRCNECHSLAGSERSDGVMLQEAMHSLDSAHSCVGCHQNQKSEAQCAGCHDLMEQGRLTEHACKTCHIGPDPGNLAVERSMYDSLADFRLDESIVYFKPDAGEIPDTVRIGIIADEYEQAVMPHRKIVNTLKRHIAENKMAARFHGHEDVVCQGCHHHGSVGTKPALCENCHGKPFNEHALFRPGLYGAYHQQCLGCHTSMNLQKETDCVICHKKRQGASAATIDAPASVRE